MKELLADEITDREMCEIQVADIPAGIVRGIAAHPFTEESQFESKSAPFRGLQISGVIPPFGLKIRMAEIIAREFKTIPGYGRLELRQYRLQHQQNCEERRRNGSAVNLHAPPQADSGAPQ